MKKFKPLYTFASLWKQFVLFTKNWRRKPTGELVNKDTLELDNATITTLNGEEHPSVKPLYFHPITVYATTAILTMIIINNDATAFTKTTFLQYVLDNYESARILVNGAIKAGSYYLSPAYLRVKSNAVFIVGIDNNGTPHNEDSSQISFTSIVESEGTLFFDSVNKIN